MFAHIYLDMGNSAITHTVFVKTEDKYFKNM